MLAIQPLVAIWRVLRKLTLFPPPALCWRMLLHCQHPSLPNDPPSDPTALPKGTNLAVAKPTPSLPNATPSDPALVPESTNHAVDVTDSTRLVCGSVASGIWCLLDTPPMQMVNCTTTKSFARSCKKSSKT